MPPKTSTTRLPKSVLEELGLRSKNPKSKTRFNTATGGRSDRRNDSRNGSPPDRKARRRQDRLVKKSQYQQRQASHASGPPGSPSPSPEPIARQEQKKPEPKEKKGKKEKDPEPPLKSILRKERLVKRVRDDNEEEKVWEKKPVLRRAVREQLEQDDMEIEYLEKKLKIKSKLPKSFEEDGLDFLFEGLCGIGREGKLRPKVGDRGREAKSSSRREMQEMEEEGDDEDMEGFDEDTDEDEGESEDEQDEFMGILDIEETQAEGSNATPETKTPKTPSTSKYVPPSLRKSQATDSEKLVHLRRKCHGILNRLSEANLIPILSEVENLYTTNPRGDVTSTLSDLLITIVGDQSALSDTFMILHGGFVAGVYKIMGTDFGAHVVQAVIEDFDGHYKKVNGIKDPASAGKKCTNLISFISELYNFQVVGAMLVFDLLRIFLGEITELNTELLLKVARNSGHQLRQDDPASLKDLVLMIQPAIAKIGYENLSVRTKFMIETLTSLKNNRLKFATANSVVVSEATIRMKRLLGALNARKIRTSEPLRVSLADIRNTDAKGKWWLVGASWAGNQTSTPTTPSEPAKTPTKNTKKDPEDADFYSSTDLLQLAREQRMNTDIRQAVFVAIMSAEDYTDAYFRILKLRLKRKQEPEIPRVLIHCCGSEASYNPYYTLVARKLCAQNLRMAFTFTLWGVFRRMGEGEGGKEEAELFDEDGEGDEGGLDIRKILNLSRMYGTLIAQDALGLDVLKILDIAYLQSKTKTFLELMFITVILQTLGQENGGLEKSLTRVFVKIRDNSALVRGVLFFLKKHVKGTDVVNDGAEAAVVARGVRFSCKLLESFIAKETLGER